MTDGKRGGEAGEKTRFKKGQSGNSNGRPRSQPRFAPSAYNIIIDRIVTITKDGQQREATMAEALQIKNYNLAIKGNSSAIIEVLRMIAAREKALPKTTELGFTVKHLTARVDPNNAFDAMLLLNIAELDTSYADVTEPDDRRLHLLPWAVQAALNRRGLKKTSERERADINMHTLNRETLKWPKRFDREG